MGEVVSYDRFFVRNEKFRCEVGFDWDWIEGKG